MSVATKDGAWIHAELWTEIRCDKCGLVARVRGDVDRKVDDAIRRHARDKHGGIDRG